MAWLNSIPTWVIWLGLYFGMLAIVPARKLCKGYFARYVLRRFIPPKRWWDLGPFANNYRFWIWLGIDSIINLAVLGNANNQVLDLVFWSVYIVWMLDDYINGDDDPKERWEAAKNKVKWLWTPVQENHPIKAPV